MDLTKIVLYFLHFVLAPFSKLQVETSRKCLGDVSHLPIQIFVPVQSQRIVIDLCSILLKISYSEFLKKIRPHNFFRLFRPPIFSSKGRRIETLIVVKKVVLICILHYVWL